MALDVSIENARKVQAIIKANHLLLWMDFFISVWLKQFQENVFAKLFYVRDIVKSICNVLIVGRIVKELSIKPSAASLFIYLLTSAY